MLTKEKRSKAPLNDVIITAVAKLVDDAKATREPSHYELETLIQKTRLIDGDPKAQGQTVGKAKRIRAVLSWAFEYDNDAGEVFVAALISELRGKGGFRPGSPNYVGEQPITEAVEAFRSVGYLLTIDGDLAPNNLDTLSGIQLTAALQAYVRRAQRGSEDAALSVGTGKDLLEATAAHVIVVKFGHYPSQVNFPTLLGQAFVAKGFKTPHDPVTPGEPPQAKLQRALYEAGCAVNSLRNKQGTGHGRPWLPTVTQAEAHAAVQTMGIIAGMLLE